jgi:hypothetical protein
MRFVLNRKRLSAILQPTISPVICTNASSFAARPALGLGRVTQLRKSGCGGSSFLGADDLTGITHIEANVLVILRRLKCT